MKTVGTRVEPQISLLASGDKLTACGRFNDELHRGLPTGHTTFFPKGVYRYQTLEEAHEHWVECVARGMAKLALAKDSHGRIPPRHAERS